MRWSLLRNRSFVLLWAAQILSTLGNELYNIGVMVTIFEETGSALQTAGVFVARMVPALILGPAAGVIIDRYPRRLVLVGMNLAQALLLWALLLAGGGETSSTWSGYAIVIGLATAQTFYRPAQQAILPDIVSRAELVRANSLMMSTNQAILMASYAVGGVLILQYGTQLLVIISLATYLVGAAATVLIVAPERPATAEVDRPDVGFLRAVWDGLVYVRDHPLARPLVVMETFEHWPHGIWISALMLVFTREALQAGTQAWGYQGAAFFAGQLAGALVAVFVAERLARRAGWVIIGSAFLYGVLTLAYAVSPTVLFAVFVSFVFGPPSAIRDVTQDALLQATASPELMGRVYATRDTLARISFMLAGVAFAWLADQVSVRWVYLIGGVMYVGTALYALSSAAIRHSRIRDGETDALAGPTSP
jgi:MFS family permease